MLHAVWWPTNLILPIWWVFCPIWKCRSWTLSSPGNSSSAVDDEVHLRRKHLAAKCSYLQKSVKIYGTTRIACAKHLQQQYVHLSPFFWNKICNFYVNSHQVKKMNVQKMRIKRSIKILRIIPKKRQLTYLFRSHSAVIFFLTLTSHCFNMHVFMVSMKGNISIQQKISISYDGKLS